MTEQIEIYAQQTGSNQEVLRWIKTTGRKSIIKKLTNEKELEHIIDYFNSNSSPSRLQKMSIKDAKRKAQEWQEANQKKGRHLKDMENDIEVIHDFECGSMIVKLLTKNSYQREGFLMSHCLGGYSPGNDADIYSYRDEFNNPHATFEVRKNCNEIIQIKGKGNGAIHPKYVEPILIFLEILGIDVRASEMKNLGYYYICETHIEFLKGVPRAWGQVVKVRGSYYAV